MMNLELTDGRTIQLRALKVSGTYDGHLEGNRQSISERIRERLAAQARDIPLQVIAGSDPLPAYRCEAQFNSDAVNPAHRDLDSRLQVVWFTDDVPDSLTSLLAPLRPAVRWNEFAREYDPWDILG